MKILVLCAMKPNLHVAIKERQRQNFDGLQAANPTLDIHTVIDERGTGDSHITTLQERVAHVAPIRQALIDDYLTDHHYVFFIDADILYYDLPIITQLVERSHGNIVAPMVFMVSERSHFYDTAGFIQLNGRHVGCREPHLTAKGAVEMQAVGCFYCIPGQVFRHGAKYALPKNPLHVEHYSICEYARKQMRRRCFLYTDLKVYHVKLADFGESPH